MLSHMTSPIRLRALRAAQVASLSVGLVSLSGCPDNNTNTDAASSPDAFAAVDAFAAPDAPVVLGDGGVVEDAPVALADGGVAEDAAVADAGSAEDAAFTSDAGCPETPMTQECCVLAGGSWDAKSMFCAVAVPGPFVPPSMNV